MNDIKDVKQKKKKGPLRWEAILPITIILLLLALYFRFFFDSNLRSLLSYTASSVHGAEVNIGYVNTSFINPEIKIGKIEVTDKEMPERNIFSLGLIRFKILGDALLRAKFVVEDASIKEIEVFSPRKSKGEVYPPSKSKGAANTVRELEAAAIEETKKQYDQNVLGDLVSVLGGVDPEEQLKNIQTNLKAEKRAEVIEKMAKEKEEAWKKRIEDLPSEEEFDKLVKRAKALEFSSKDPIKSLKNIRELEKIIEEADKKVEAYESAKKDLDQDYKSLRSQVKGFEDLVKQDIEDLKNRLNIPDIDGKNLSKSIFMSYLDDKIAALRKYQAVAKEYMPKKKAKEESSQVVPPRRGEGETILFPITVGYPLFWLKKAEISSKAYPENKYSGDLQGKIQDITSAPSYIKRPAILELKGGFPYQKIEGLRLNIEVDHTGEKAKQSFDFKIASMPVSKITLADSDDISLAIENSTGVLDFNGTLVDKKLNIIFENYLRNPEFSLDAKSKEVKSILSNVFNSIAFVSIYGKFMGSWGDLDLRVSSNIGDEIIKGLKKEVQAKVNQAKRKIENYVNERLSDEREKIESEISGLKNQIEDKINKQKAKVEQKVSQAKQELKKGKDSQKDKAKDKLKKELKNLLDF